MLAVAALARATASNAYAYGARRLGAPAAGAARAVSSRACAVSRDAAPGGNNADAGEALAARLRAVAAATPDRVAVVTPGGEEVTFGSLLAHAERVAGSLRARRRWRRRGRTAMIPTATIPTRTRATTTSTFCAARAWR